jgi:hypothetical protein
MGPTHAPVRTGAAPTVALIVFDLGSVRIVELGEFARARGNRP